MIIKSIEPEFVITKDGSKEIMYYTVYFQVSKKTTSSGDSITIDGSLRFPSPDTTIDLNKIQNRILSNLNFNNIKDKLKTQQT